MNVSNAEVWAITGISSSTVQIITAILFFSLETYNRTVSGRHAKSDCLIRSVTKKCKIKAELLINKQIYNVYIIYYVLCVHQAHLLIGKQ